MRAGPEQATPYRRAGEVQTDLGQYFFIFRQFQVSPMGTHLVAANESTVCRHIGIKING
jgi:hypothetical protein